jgi:hypothetical protein
MSLAQTAILASALRPKGEKASRPAPSSITESVAQRPIQWLVVGGVVAYVAYKLIDKAIVSGKERDIIDAETSSRADNPFQYSSFLQKNIPKKDTNILNSAAAYKAAKQIYDELNSFFVDNDDVVIGVFSSLSSKYKVAQMAQAFNQYFKRDILTYMKEGKKTFSFGVTGGISDDNYTKIITMVNKKPTY